MHKHALAACVRRAWERESSVVALAKQRSMANLLNSRIGILKSPSARQPHNCLSETEQREKESRICMESEIAL